MTPSRTPSILIVDDEPDIVEFVSEFLSTFSARVLVADSGEKALQVASENTLDLIISDISMSKMNGIQMLKKLRNKKVNTPVIFITGHGDKEVMKQAWDLGAFDFIDKPLARDHFLRVVDAALAFGFFSSKSEKIASKKSDNRLGFAKKRISELPISTTAPCCTASTTVAEAVKTMIETKVGAIAITGPSNQVEGIFTERDLLNKVSSSASINTSKPISEFMTPSPKCVRMTSSALTSFSIMRMGRFRNLIIVDDENKYLGMLSLRDAFSYICDWATGAETD